MDESNDIIDLSYEAPNSSKVDSESRTPYTDAVKCRKTVKHVKRPLNPFMIWSQMERRKILEQNPNIQCAEISIQLGKRWKELSDRERIPFAVEAERLRKLHSQEFPDYKFSPKPKRKKNVDANSPNMKKVTNVQSSNPVNDVMKELVETEDLISRNNLNNMKKKRGEKCETAVSESIERKLNNAQQEGSLKNDQNHFPIETSQEEVSKVIKKRRKRLEKFSNITTEGKHVWDNLTGIKITSLAIDKTDSTDICKSDDSSQQLKQSSSKKPLPPRLYIDNCLTSGSIAALACYRDDWSAVFDYLTDKVLQSSKNIYEEIGTISRQYGEACESLGEDYPNEPTELDIPEINKVLGRKWKDPNFGLKFSS